MFMYYRVIIISLFLIGLSCKENTIQPEFFGSISGIVLNQEDSQPVTGAGVTTNPPSSAIVTNNAGRFTLDDLPIGNYTVTITKEGFKKGSATVAVKEDRTTDATIFLEKSESNSPPNAPKNPSPISESLNQPTLLELKWSASDDDGDSLIFDIFLYKSNSPVPIQVASDYTDTSYLVEDLDYSTTYFWQIISKDTSNASTNGNIWSFKTKEFPNHNILFTSRESGNYKIYSTSLTDTSSIKLTNTSRALWPRFNTNKTRIAFSSDESVVPHIYIMNRDGSDSRVLTSIPIAGYHNYGIGFCWSSDGEEFFIVITINFTVLIRMERILV
jgi:TolB protein